MFPKSTQNVYFSANNEDFVDSPELPTKNERLPIWVHKQMKPIEILSDWRSLITRPTVYHERGWIWSGFYNERWKEGDRSIETLDGIETKIAKYFPDKHNNFVNK